MLYDPNTPKMFEVSMQSIKYKADNFFFYLKYQHGVHVQEVLQTHKSQNDLGVWQRCLVFFIVKKGIAVYLNYQFGGS